jgi:GTP diphosphokinase / guanosine-3',5'-bis(diphosphate) 3'-diphosphatase
VPNAGPSRDWLKIVVTPRARNKIRQWFSRERREDAIDSGRDELIKAIRKEGLPNQKLSGSSVLLDVAQAMNYNDLDALHAAIGEKHVSAQAVAQRLARELRGGDHEEQLPTTVRRPRRITNRAGSAVHVEGLDDIMVRLSRCCTPVPGDEIIGFVTRGRGVSVHRADCANAAALSADDVGRMIEVEWDRERADSFTAAVELKAFDRSGLGVDVWRSLSELHLNVLRSESLTGSDRVSRMRFEFELADPAHLDSLLGSLKRIDGVYDAYRVVPGHGS